MELDELIMVWKKQDKNINKQIHNETLRHLLNQKSEGALSKIRRHLLKELVVIGLVSILCNVLFVLVHLPYTGIRWMCFLLFNFISLWYIYHYAKAVFSSFKPRYNKDLRENIERLVKSLEDFRNKYKLLTLPTAFLLIVMFAGSQNLLLLVPWMALEFLLWRSVLLPKLMVRFEVYKSDLEYALRNLQALSE